MLKFTAACHLASVQCHDGKALSKWYSPAQICKGKMAASRFETYTLHFRRDESKATPPLHDSTSHQNPTTSISIDIAPQHPHLHKRSLHNSSATLRRIPFSAQQLATPTPHHTFTRYPDWIPTPNPTTTPSHLNSVLSHFPILVFSLFWHHELHFWGFSPAATQWRSAQVVAARAMVFGWDEWTMTRTRWLMLLLAPEMGGLMFRDMPSSGSALRFFDRFRNSFIGFV